MNTQADHPSAGGGAKLEGFLSACDPTGEMALASAPASSSAMDQHNRGWQRLGKRVGGCSSRLRTPTYSSFIFERLWSILINARMVATRCGDAFVSSGAASPKLFS